MSFSPLTPKNSKSHFYLTNFTNRRADKNISTDQSDENSVMRQNKNNNMHVTTEREQTKPGRAGNSKSDKPRIAINLDIHRGKTTVYQVNRAYINAILLAGGIPVIIPTTKQRDMITLLADCDGVLLIGGRDYSPQLYGETPSSTISALDFEREEFDLRFVKHIVNRTKLPILGICGGLQLINIHFGGSLIQDIESAHPGLGEEHRSEVKQPHADHPVALKSGGMLRKIYGRSRLPSVVSSHHQAIKTLGKGLQLECCADDGIAEGLSHCKRNYLIGVQWHPEQDYAANKRLFRSLIKAAKAAKEAKLAKAPVNREQSQR
ncbi:MAG: gamma-glutamyl-gamma-aminobutyrate hydrolase family protein [Candidatus Obscuribacterales bacterium]|jgi:putative glutamine amidotransferase